MTAPVSLDRDEDRLDLERAAVLSAGAKPTLRAGMFSECYTPVQNGVTTSVRTLVRELRALNNHVFVVAPHFQDYEDETPLVIRVPSIQTRLNADYPLMYPWYRRLRRRLARMEPDIIHAHSPFNVGILASKLADIEGAPLIATYHTLYNHYAHYVFFLPDQAIQTLLKWWLPEYYHRCAAVIVPSATAEESLRSYGVRSDVHVIPTGVPLPAPADVSKVACRAARLRFGIPADAQLVLYVGRLAREKNIEQVLEAFDSVAANRHNRYLLIAGTGPHEESLRRMAGGLAAADRVLFAGGLEHDSLAPLYAASDVFAFASVTETQGLVIAEARAAGTPCVVARGGGACETVRSGEDGLVVDPGGGSLAEGLEHLLDDRTALDRMSVACLRNAPQFTPAAMANRVLSLYRSVLGSRPPVRPSNEARELARAS